MWVTAVIPWIPAVWSPHDLFPAFHRIWKHFILAPTIQHFPHIDNTKMLFLLKEDEDGRDMSRPDKFLGNASMEGFESNLKSAISATPMILRIIINFAIVSGSVHMVKHHPVSRVALFVRLTGSFLVCSYKRFSKIISSQSAKIILYKLHCKIAEPIIGELDYQTS